MKYRLKLGSHQGSTYERGLAAERSVKRRLEARGWLVRQSKGSRGPNDLYALKNGRIFLIQVKSGTVSASREEIQRLRNKARDIGGRALVMKVTERKTTSRFV